MKKLFLLLFTLLVAANSAIADSFFYVDPIEITEDMQGSIIDIPVHAHFDARLDSWIVKIVIPDGLTRRRVTAGSDMTISYENEFEETVTLQRGLSSSMQNDTLVVYSIPTEEVLGYESGEPYGNVKWESGDYYEMFFLRLRVDNYYGDGQLYIKTIVNSSSDTRGGTVVDNGDSSQPYDFFMDIPFITYPIPPTPEIQYEEGDDGIFITLFGDGELMGSITLDGNYLTDIYGSGQFEYYVERDYDDHLIEVIAWVANGNAQSEQLTYNIILTAKERPITPAPEIQIVEDCGETVVILITGEGLLRGSITQDGYLETEFEAENDYAFTLCRDYETHEFVITATATAPECEQSDVAVFCYYLDPMPMPETPMPVMAYEVTEDAVVVTIVGDGMLYVYIDGVEYYGDGDYNMRVISIPRGEEDVIVHIEAYAQLEGWYPSQTKTWEIMVPALEQIYDFEEGGIFYKINGDGKVSVTYETTNYNSYSGQVVIPATVTHDGVTYKVTGINDRAFMFSAGLTGVTIGNYVTTIGADAFLGCTGLTNVVLGDYVITVGGNAFNGCTSLASVTLGSGVRSIGTQAFKNCTALTSVICKPATPPTMATSNCFDCYSTATLTVHPAVVDSYSTDNKWKQFTTIVESVAVSPAAGDTNGDGEVNIADVTSLIDQLLGNH